MHGKYPEIAANNGALKKNLSQNFNNANENHNISLSHSDLA